MGFEDAGTSAEGEEDCNNAKSWERSRSFMAATREGRSAHTSKESRSASVKSGCVVLLLVLCLRAAVRREAACAWEVGVEGVEGVVTGGFGAGIVVLMLVVVLVLVTLGFGFGFGLASGAMMDGWIRVVRDI